MTAEPIGSARPTLEQTLEHARRVIEVAKPELAEARTRRDDIAATLRSEFPGSRTYVNGSVAHGDALTPLTDVDLGVVVPDPDGIYGPDKCGPHDLKERAAETIRAALKPTYGELAVEVQGRKRSILIRFREPVAPGRPDFTADVIVAIDNSNGAGLYIPRWDSWDRSHPEKHTELVLAAIEATDRSHARIVRLLKHWSRRHDKPLCSWHIKALALGCITSPTTLVNGLLTWFTYATDQLATGDTPDPAGVAEKPIKTNKPRTIVARQLRVAAERVERAIRLEREGYDLLALDELAKLFNDHGMLARPNLALVTAQEGLRIAAEKAKDTGRLGAPALLTGTGAGARHDRPNVRSWAL